MGSIQLNLAGSEDPVNFIPAESYFAEANNFSGPRQVFSASSSKSTDSKDPLRYAVALTFDDGTICLIQYVMTTVWRIRYDPTVKSVSRYPAQNTRTVVQDSFASLVDGLQESRADGTRWRTKLDTSANGSYFTFSTIKYSDEDSANADKDGIIMMTLNIFKSPFSLQAVRSLKQQVTNPAVTRSDSQQVVWQTNEQPLRYGQPDLNLNNITMNVMKRGSSQYLGFGEQGGQTLLKSPSFMNYYCYDNANANQIYNQGPTDQREPLYHSDPYMIEMNGAPGYANITGTFIDNYSQVCVDLGSTNAGNIGIGLRFGYLDTYIMSADQASELIWMQTSLIGRPRLKPRFILGHHQGCYGYRTRSEVENVVSSYRAAKIPLDGMHIDVDFQEQYRTFTWDPVAFPNVQDMFSGLRAQGVKCCTNITPIITLNGGPNNDDYPTLKEALDNNYLIADKRYLEGTDGNPYNVRYINFSGNLNQDGVPIANNLNPNDPSSRPEFGDNYKFAENYNSGYPYHGGVSYGGSLGTAGYYLDLNREDIRDFWGKQYKALFDVGLEFVWQDMTTPAVAIGYGDMKGFPSRLLISTDESDPADKDRVSPPKKTAIELWALYSYNLHKATYNGLNNLPSRANKRNFIIGRGSFAGMHRYAGLWTGDNASTWSFWQICISQIINLGYSGMSIAGVDMGGFLQDGSNQFCDPDLLIRWYSGAFMLPWYRNHYIARLPGQKLFQEPYQYTNYLNSHPEIQASQGWLYSSVQPICQYYVQLRYSLIQILYDSMFEHQINGLPIARSLLISDPDDSTLLNKSAPFLNNEYIIRNALLICPVMESHTVNNGNRSVYLPLGSKWYDFNLRIDGSYGVALQPYVKGGSIFNYSAYIGNDWAHMPYVTPIYVREGSIIPQLQVRQSLSDTATVNPFTIHVYPGKATTYSMYLDDGVSRSSAPTGLPQYSSDDDEAKGEYREVVISHVQSANQRTVTLLNAHDGYDPTALHGDTYTIVIWRDPRLEPTVPSVAFTDAKGQSLAKYCSSTYDSTVFATIVTTPISLINGQVNINLSY